MYSRQVRTTVSQYIHVDMIQVIIIHVSTLNVSVTGFPSGFKF